MRLDIPKIVPHLMKQLEDHKSGSIADIRFNTHLAWLARVFPYWYHYIRFAYCSTHDMYKHLIPVGIHALSAHALSAHALSAHALSAHALSAHALTVMLHRALPACLDLQACEALSV